MKDVIAWIVVAILLLFISVFCVDVLLVGPIRAEIIAYLRSLIGDGGILAIFIVATLLILMVRSFKAEGGDAGADTSGADAYIDGSSHSHSGAGAEAAAATAGIEATVVDSGGDSGGYYDGGDYYGG